MRISVLVTRVAAALILSTVTASGCVAASTPGQDPPPPPPPPAPPLVCTPGGTVLPAGDGEVTLDVSRRFQTIRGFGTTERLFDDPHLTNTFNASTGRSAVVVPAGEQAKIMDALYGELGLTRVRYNPRDNAVNVGIESFNDNADPEVTDLSRFNFAWKNNDGHIDYVKSAIPRGLTTWWASPGTLETWMDESNPAEYVEWAMAILRRWRAQGVEMPWWSIVNEPGIANFRIYSGEYLRDVIKDEFDRTLGGSIDQIHEASTVKA